MYLQGGVHMATPNKAKPAAQKPAPAKAPAAHQPKLLGKLLEDLERWTKALKSIR